MNQRFQYSNTKLNIDQQKINSLDSQISQQRNLLSYTTVLAPFDGVVAKKLLNTGDLAGSTSPILQISGLGGYRVIVKVPVQVATQINRQDKSLVTYGDQVVKAQIDQVLPAGENNLSVIELRLPDNTFQVPVHTFLQVQIPAVAQQNGIIIPVDVFTIIKTCNYAVLYGNIDMASIGYVGYVIIAGSVFGNYAEGYDLACTGIRLAERCTRSYSKC